MRISDAYFNFRSGMPIFTINLGISIGIGMHENGHPGALFQGCLFSLETRGQEGG